MIDIVDIDYLSKVDGGYCCEVIVITEDDRHFVNVYYANTLNKQKGVQSMKSALLTAFKAFVSQVRENNLEMAKKTVERNGYQVLAKTETKAEPNNKQDTHAHACVFFYYVLIMNEIFIMNEIVIFIIVLLHTISIHLSIFVNKYQF